MATKGSITNKPATNRIELTGLKFGRLLVIRSVRKADQARLFWECQCDCGKTVVICGQNLRIGMTQSCGCLQKERVLETCFKHGLSHTSIHNTWMSMKQRCEDDHCKAYPQYGGRGIKVCERWHEFNNFYADMGLPPQKGMTLDRFPNNDGNYEPGNVRWATKKEQANNRRSSHLLTFEGKTQTIAQWEDEVGHRRGVINNRLFRGWTTERAITVKTSEYRGCHDD